MNFSIGPEDLAAALQTRTDGKEVYRFGGTPGADVFIFRLTAADTRGIKVSAFGLGGPDSFSFEPSLEPLPEYAFYGGHPRGELGASFPGDPNRNPGNDRFDLSAGGKGAGDFGDDRFFLHPSDYERDGPAEIWADIRPGHDQIFMSGDRGFRVTDFEFKRIEHHGDQRIGHLSDVTIRALARNPLVSGGEAWIRTDERNGPRPDVLIEWEAGPGAKAEAVRDFVESGVGEWLFL